MDVGEVDGRCYLLLHSLASHEVQSLSTSTVPGLDVPGILIDRSPARIRQAVRGLLEVEAQHWGEQHSWASLPALDPFASSSSSSSLRVNVLDSAHLDAVLSSSRKAQLLAQLQSSEVHRCPAFASHLAVFTRHALLSDRVERLRASLDESNLSQMSDYQAKLQLLRRLEYVDDDLHVQLKGRVACELNTCDSIIGTELIFNNVMGDLTPQETVPALSIQHPSAPPRSTCPSLDAPLCPPLLLCALLYCVCACVCVSAICVVVSVVS